MSIQFDIRSGEPVDDPAAPDGTMPGEATAWPQAAPKLLSVAEAEAVVMHDTRRPHPAVVAAAAAIRPSGRVYRRE